MDKVISIETMSGPYQMLLDNILRMVPDRDRGDVDLQRLLAFRLRIDGESATREYLMRKIRDMIQTAHKGRLYDFLKEGQAQPSGQDRPTSPEIA
jgi:hypothetical protein